MDWCEERPFGHQAAHHLLKFGTTGNIIIIKFVTKLI